MGGSETQIFIFFGFLDAIVNLVVFTRLIRNERYQKTISGTPAILFLLVAIKALEHCCLLPA